jgi:hypothetical protein
MHKELRSVVSNVFENEKSLGFSYSGCSEYLFLSYSFSFSYYYYTIVVRFESSICFAPSVGAFILGYWGQLTLPCLSMFIHARQSTSSLGGGGLNFNLLANLLISSSFYQRTLILTRLHTDIIQHNEHIKYILIQ